MTDTPSSIVSVDELVKPLEWQDRGDLSLCRTDLTSNYTIRKVDEGYAMERESGVAHVHSLWTTLDAAKAFAQDNHAKELLSALNLAALERLSAERDEAVRLRNDWFKRWRTIIDGVLGNRPLCRDCADNNGICPNRDGLPCEPSAEVVELYRRAESALSASRAEVDGYRAAFVAARAAQGVLAEYIVPDSGISDTECVNRLLGILDHQELVRSMRAAEGR